MLCHIKCSCLSCYALKVVPASWVMAMKIVPVCLVKPTEVGPASQVAHWDHTRPAFGCVWWVPQRRFLLVVFHQRRLFLPVLSCPRKLILSVLLSPQRLFLLVNLCPLMSFQTSYLLLLTSPSESVPASHVPPVEAVPEHTAPRHDLWRCSRTSCSSPILTACDWLQKAPTHPSTTACTIYHPATTVCLVELDARRRPLGGGGSVRVLPWHTVCSCLCCLVLAHGFVSHVLLYPLI